MAPAAARARVQEGVWHVPHFKFSGYMTLVTAATMAACGQLERVFTGDHNRIGSLQSYLKLSLLTLSGMYFTNWSLQYLNYPTRVLFKSSKLVPTMLAGTVMQGRKYSLLEYLAAGGLVAGVVLFTLGDAELLPSFHSMGILLIAIGVVGSAGDAPHTLLQEPHELVRLVGSVSRDFRLGNAAEPSLEDDDVGQRALLPARLHVAARRREQRHGVVEQELGDTRAARRIRAREARQARQRRPDRPPPGRDARRVLLRRLELQPPERRCCST